MSHGKRQFAYLEKASFARLCFALLRQRFSGSLELEQPGAGATRSIWWRGGMPIFTDWDDAASRLGAMVVSAGYGSESAVEPIASGAGDKLVGHALRDAGIIDARQLGQALGQQLSARLAHMFALRQGKVAICPGTAEPAHADDCTQLNVLSLIARTVPTQYDLGRVSAEMGRKMTSKRLIVGSALSKYRAHFGFGPSYERPLGLLVQGTTFEEVAALLAGDQDRAAQLVFTLWACQMLEMTEAVAPSSARASAWASAPASASPAPPRPRVASGPKPAAQPPASTPKTTPPASPAPPAQRPATPATKPAAKPAAASANAAKEDAAAFTAELERLEAKVAEHEHAFALFDLELSAEKKDVRARWAELSRRFHPDGLQARGLGELRDRVEQVFAALSEAQLVLNNKEEREQLLMLIESTGGKVRGDQNAAQMVRDAFESEVLAKEAERFVRAGRFDHAKIKLEEALALTPDEVDLQITQAWIDFNLTARGPDDIATAAGRLTALLEQSPNAAAGHYYRGLVLKLEGNYSGALIAFQRAGELDKHLVDAERQARAVRSMMAKGTEPGPAGPSKGSGKSKAPAEASGFRRLFGKR